MRVPAGTKVRLKQRIDTPGCYAAAGYETEVVDGSEIIGEFEWAVVVRLPIRTRPEETVKQIVSLDAVEVVPILKTIRWPDAAGKWWVVSERPGFGYTPILGPFLSEEVAEKGRERIAAEDALVASEGG